jgi:hypothetical protein
VTWPPWSGLAARAEHAFQQCLQAAALAGLLGVDGAPRPLASCTANPPTIPAAPVTSTTSPLLTPAACTSSGWGWDSLIM